MLPLTAITRPIRLQHIAEAHGPPAAAPDGRLDEGDGPVERKRRAEQAVGVAEHAGPGVTLGLDGLVPDHQAAARRLGREDDAGAQAPAHHPRLGEVAAQIAGDLVGVIEGDDGAS